MPGVRALRWGLWIAPALLAGCSGKPASHAGAGTLAGAAGAGAVSDGGQSQVGFGNASSAMPAKRSDASMPMQPAPNCAGKTQDARPVEVDMYIMLDRSGSMTETTGAGNTKWDAIRQALTTFVQDGKSAGLGVGLQYFPLGAPGVPEQCNADADCGKTGGQCLNSVCWPSSPSGTFTPMVCLSLNDCPRATPSCAPFGICENDAMLACFNLRPIGPTGCPSNGACTVVPGGCLNYASCNVADYATPAVPIDLLPANAQALTGSLMAEKPLGLTPTPAALSGALSRATTHATQHPDHRVVALLATDGLPTDCLLANTQTVDQAVTDTANIAAQGLAQSPSIETYVIGVFGPNDPSAMQKLDQVAVAGGTAHAFIVDSSKDVSQQLLDALATIRGGVLTCELELPQAPAGQTLDFNLVNVQFTESGQKHDLLYVRSADQCSKAALGWFYDVDPKQGQTPTKINVCPRTCETLQAAHNASTEIRLGCATMGPL
jgi:hypothetical protein